MGCQEVHSLLDRYLALELPPAAEEDVRRHLSECRPCLRSLEERDPAAALALRLSAAPASSDEDFAAAVMAGVRQRKLQRVMAHRRRRWLAAAGIGVALLGGAAGLRAVRSGPPVVARAQPAAVSADGPFLEVQGANVKVYEMAPDPAANVRIAMIVDPALEL